MTQEYEILYFTSITLNPEEIANVKKQVNNIITENNGTVIKEDELGKKKLSYMIKHTRHGYFILTIFSSAPKNIEQIKKGIKLISKILRYRLIIHEKTEPVKIINLEKKQIEKNKKIIKKESIKDKKETKLDKINLEELDLKIDKLLSDTEENL